MKILFLNPHLYESPVLGTLRKLGVAAIVCADLPEADLVFKLHATSISLFVGHDDDGIAMNELLKKNPRFSRTPVILTTSKWTDQQCIEHQATPFGANAYLRMPVDDKIFIHIIDQILGTELSHGKGFQLSDDLAEAGPLDAAGPLEIASSDGLSIEMADEPTKLAVSNASPTEGITLQTNVGPEFAFQSGLQIEDGATVHGYQNPESSGPVDPELMFNLESPELESQQSASKPSPAEDHGTKEFQIDGTVGGAPPVASEILATPIAATSIDAIAPVLGEEPTRVSMPGLSAPAPVEPPVQASDELDAESLAAMPYLSRGGYSNPLGYREPMDDSVVPGGAATAPDVETLKKYLYLREQDVTALSGQLRQAREQIGLLEGQLRHERAVSSEFAHLAQEQDRRIDGFEKEKAVALESAQREFDDLKFEMKRRSEKIRVMELQVKEATEATERLKERVRTDIRKIRTREKELENRLEIMKKDSEALLGSREQKIIELKRKLDLMEFNTDLIQDLLEKERQCSSGLREKLAKAAQMMRVAGGILGPEEESIIAASVNEERNTAA